MIFESLIIIAANGAGFNKKNGRAARRNIYVCLFVGYHSSPTVNNNMGKLYVFVKFLIDLTRHISR